MDVVDILYLGGGAHDIALALCPCRRGGQCLELVNVVFERDEEGVEGVEAIVGELSAQRILLILVGRLPVFGTLSLESLVGDTQVERVEMAPQRKVGHCPSCPQQGLALCFRACSALTQVDAVHLGIEPLSEKWKQVVVLRCSERRSEFLPGEAGGDGDEHLHLAISEVVFSEKHFY